MVSCWLLIVGCFTSMHDFNKCFLKNNKKQLHEIEEVDHCQLTNTAFSPGEKMVYKIYYNWGFIWMPAGEVTFNVEEEGDIYHYKVIGKTYNSYNWFF